MVVARRGRPMGSSAVAPPPPLFSSMAAWGAIRRAAVPRRRQSEATPVSTLGDAGSTAGGGRGLLRSDRAELKGGGSAAGQFDGLGGGAGVERRVGGRRLETVGFQMYGRNFYCIRGHAAWARFDA